MGNELDFLCLGTADPCFRSMQVWPSLPLFSFPHLVCSTEQLTQLTIRISPALQSATQKVLLSTCCNRGKKKKSILKLGACNIVT